MRPFFLLFSLAILSSSCVKDEGIVSEANNSNGTTSGGTSTGGTSTGGTSTGSSSQTDPLLAESWHYHSDGKGTGYSTSLAQNDADINVTSVHEDLGIKGAGIRIAISDTGVELTHPDLAGNTLSKEHRSYVYNDPGMWLNADPTPGSGASEPHGTSVAGLISAIGWNGIGSRGIAPLSKFAAFKYIFTPLYQDDESILAKQIDQLIGNFDIFNQSYGKAGYLFVETETEVEETLRVNTLGSPNVAALRNGKGAIYIQAAGNSYTESYFYPMDNDDDLNDDAGSKRTADGNTNAHEELSSPFKIVVGALSGMSSAKYGMKASYSTPGSSIWISAPGGEDGITQPAMITTDMESCRSGYSFRSFLYPNAFDFGFHASNTKCDYTNSFNGTSAATPVISGVVALMLEANPKLTWRDVKHILAMTADKIDKPIDADLLKTPNFIVNSSSNKLPLSPYDYKWTKNNAGVYFSNWYGFGKVNAKAAVDMALNDYDLSTLGTFEETMDSNGTWYYESGALNQAINDNSTTGTLSAIWVGHNYIIEHVQIELMTTHNFPGDLAISLTSPKGTFSNLLTVNNKIFGGAFEKFKMSSNAFYNEESNGFWTLRVTDGDGSVKNVSYNSTTKTYSTSTGTGNLVSWKIHISGHKKSTELKNPPPPTGIVINDTQGTNPPTSISYNPPAGYNSVEYEVGIFTTNDTPVKNWTSNANQQNFIASAPVLSPGTVYRFKVRAKDPASGKWSSIQVKEWTEK
jgi:subtilisin-like proprotein convertase family protein/subtilisin family serine protease